MRDWLRLPERVPLRLRLFFRGVFLLLALATLAMALGVLVEEKQRGHDAYRAGLAKTLAQISARLRHPTGQLALLNPRSSGDAPLAPLLLPFSAIDFDDKAKVQQAVEMAGCGVRYVDGAMLCVAVGNNPFAGGFIYLAGSVAAGTLVAHTPGDLNISAAHRMRVAVAMRGQGWRWIAPFEALPEAPGGTVLPGVRGRLTGYVDKLPLLHGAKTVRDFRGWLWQDARCLDESAGGEDCARRTFFSIRLPIEVFREALFQPERGKIVWPPPDLAQTQVSLQLLAPGEGGPVLFDSASPVAEAPFALGDLALLLAPGERLVVRRAGAAGDVLTLTGKAGDERETAPWIARLIRLLPVEGYDAPIALSESMATPNGRYDLSLGGDARSVNRALAAVATRLSWFVGAMLAAIVLAWALIELRIIRRITLLTRRAASVSSGMRAADGLAHIDLKDLRSGDELGVLAQGLADLLARVNDDVRREHIRARQEKDQWHAVGHEIMSPLQSLMALHGAADDPSRRYIARMRQAVRVLYGQASPSEALAGSTLALAPLNLTQFLAHVAANADGVGIADVRFDGAGTDVRVQADEYALEDAVTHVLRNADRHRTPGSTIRIGLSLAGGLARVDIVNDGEPIDAALLDKVFEYGVSGRAETDGVHRGQGLFVARTYLAKMGGTIAASNVDGGVCFRLELPRAA